MPKYGRKCYEVCVLVYTDGYGCVSMLGCEYVNV